LLDDTTYHSQGEDLLDSTSNGTNHKHKRHRRNISSSGVSAHAVAGGFNIGNYMQQERGGPSARDVLLLKCKDAIEGLHIELQEERAIKQHMTEEMADLQRALDDF